VTYKGFITVKNFDQPRILLYKWNNTS